MYSSNKTRLFGVNKETADPQLWHVTHFILLLSIYATYLLNYTLMYIFYYIYSIASDYFN